MWPALIFAYLAGAAVTAATLFRNRVLLQGLMVNAGTIVLWPIYWSVFLGTLVVNRRKGGRGGSSKT
jgi:hypothetical protein